MVVWTVGNVALVKRRQLIDIEQTKYPGDYGFSIYWKRSFLLLNTIMMSDSVINIIFLYFISRRGNGRVYRLVNVALPIALVVCQLVIVALPLQLETRPSKSVFHSLITHQLYGEASSDDLEHRMNDVSGVVVGATVVGKGAFRKLNCPNTVTRKVVGVEIDSLYRWQLSNHWCTANSFAKWRS